MDSVIPMPGFLGITLRTGFKQIIALKDIQRVLERTEGGTSIRLSNGHLILVSTPIDQVIEAMRLASEGGAHASP